MLIFHKPPRGGLILIYRFPLSLLLFQNHRALPNRIRGYHLQTLLILPWVPYASLPFFLPPPSLRDIFSSTFRSLSYNDDDRALHDLSADFTMTSPLLCDTAYLSVS